MALDDQQRPCGRADSFSKIVAAGLLALSACCMAPRAGALAEPLPPETCEGLRSEMALLEGGGAGANIQRGVDWAKANLSPEQIRYVARLIALREQINFRCRPAMVEIPTPPLPPPQPELAPLDADKVPLPERRRQAAAKSAAVGKRAGAARPAAVISRPDVPPSPSHKPKPLVEAPAGSVQPSTAR